MDHSVRWSMKNAASCVKRCEMQDTPSTWFSNAYCGVGSFPAPRLSEGRYEIKHIIQVRTQSSRPIQSCLLVGLIHTSDRIRHNCFDSVFMRCVLSFRTLAITAEHYTFCWPTVSVRCLSRGTYSYVYRYWWTAVSIQTCLVDDVRPIKWSKDYWIDYSFCRPQIKRDYPLNLSI